MEILVVDDNAMNRKAAIAQLAGHDLTLAKDFQEAEDHLKNGEFDLVLTDLMILPNEYWQKDGFDQDEPLGSFVLLLALLKYKVKYIGLFTDTDHHKHPASACIDGFNPRETEPAVHDIGGSRVALINNRNWVTAFRADDLSVVVPYSDRKSVETVEVKNWKAVYKLVIEGTLEEDND